MLSVNRTPIFHEWIYHRWHASSQWGGNGPSWPNGTNRNELSQMLQAKKIEQKDELQ